MSHFEVLIALRTVSALNEREHWAAKAKRVKGERAETDVALRRRMGWRTQAELKRELAAGGRLVVTLGRRGRGLLDTGDNLPAALKGVRDQVAEWLGINDRDPRVRWDYEQSRWREWSVLVRIESEGNGG